MDRRPMIAGNWKMHKTPQETEVFIRSLHHALPAAKACDVLLIPPFTSLDRAGRLLNDTGIALGAQDIHQESSGAFTGAVSAAMIAACGCTYVLIGHSERRHVFGDGNDTVCRKLHAALEHGLHPILCVGETLEQRHQGLTSSVVEQQLSTALGRVNQDLLDHILIAYEPVWAIGTGETASPQQAQEATASIRSWWTQRYGRAPAQALRILYGGSVKPANACDLQTQPDVDGALVGGASLDAQSFAEIIEQSMRSQECDPAC